MFQRSLSGSSAIWRKTPKLYPTAAAHRAAAVFCVHRDKEKGEHSSPKTLHYSSSASPGKKSFELMPALSRLFSDIFQTGEHLHHKRDTLHGIVSPDNFSRCAIQITENWAEHTATLLLGQIHKISPSYNDCTHSISIANECPSGIVSPKTKELFGADVQANTSSVNIHLRITRSLPQIKRQAGGLAFKWLRAKLLLR